MLLNDIPRKTFTDKKKKASWACESLNNLISFEIYIIHNTSSNNNADLIKKPSFTIGGSRGEINIYISILRSIGEGRTETHLHGRDVPEELFNVIIVTAIARRIL